jgi:outer membrane protein assembly factor BamB
MSVNYGYRILDDFSDLAVKLDSVAVPASGSFKMTSNRTLDASAFRRVLWRYNVGAGIYYSSPAIGGDSSIYFGSGILPQKTAGSVYALTKSGVLRWSYATANSLFSPAIGNDGTIYIQDHRNSVYAFTTNGLLKWTYNQYDHVVPHNVGQHTPAIGADGTVYIPGDDGLHAVDPATAATKWRFRHPVYPGRGCLSSPVIGGDGTIYVTIGEDMLFAVRPDGSGKWSFSFTNDWEMSFTSPAIDANGVIYVGAEGYWLGQTASNIYAVNPNGTLKWKYEVEGGRFVRSSPVIGPAGTVIIATKANGSSLPAKVLALSANGQKLWDYTVEGVHATPDDVYSTPAIGADGVIYFGAETSYLYAIGMDGNLRWKFNMIGSANWSSVAITGDGMMYLGTMTGSNYEGCMMAMKCPTSGYALSPWPRFRRDNANRGRY